MLDSLFQIFEDGTQSVLNVCKRARVGASHAFTITGRTAVQTFRWNLSANFRFHQSQSAFSVFLFSLFVLTLVAAARLFV